MSFLIDKGTPAYSALESDSLKVAVTPLPVVFSARTPDPGLGVMERGAYPSPPPAVTDAGLYARSSFDDWYYRIHVIPATLALGNMSGDVQRHVVVFNAYFSSVTLEDFSVTGGGITADPGVTPPHSMPPLGIVTTVFSISATGPSVIDGTAVWTIDGVGYEVPITGVRSVLFSFRPHWRAAPVVETIEWKNTYSVSWDGRNEQIMRTRQSPRRIFEYRTRVRDADARLFDLASYGWAGRVFGLPLWHEKAKTQAAASVGATTIMVDTTSSSFADGGTAVLFRSSGEFEILDIDTVSSDSITTNNNLSRDWPAGSTVIPVLPSIPSDELNATRVLPRHLDAAVRFVASPRESVLRIPTRDVALTYRGHEVYTVETNWASPLVVNTEARRTEVDGGLGAIRVSPRAAFPSVGRTLSWLLKTRAQADDLRAFFGRRQGRRNGVWLPSGAEDFIMIDTSSLGETAIRVAKSNYNTMVSQDEGKRAARRDLVLVMRNGDRICRRINNVEDDESNPAGSVITIDSGLPYEIRPSDVKRISYLGFYRMQSDSVSFAWRTETVAQVDSAFVLKVAP